MDAICEIFTSKNFLDDIIFLHNGKLGIIFIRDSSQLTFIWENQTTSIPQTKSIEISQDQPIISSNCFYNQKKSPKSLYLIAHGKMGKIFVLILELFDTSNSNTDFETLLFFDSKNIQIQLKEKLQYDTGNISFMGNCLNTKTLEFSPEFLEITNIIIPHNTDKDFDQYCFIPKFTEEHQKVIKIKSTVPNSVKFEEIGNIDLSPPSLQLMYDLNSLSWMEALNITSDQTKDCLLVILLNEKKELLFQFLKIEKEPQLKIQIVSRYVYCIGTDRNEKPGYCFKGLVYIDPTSQNSPKKNELGLLMQFELELTQLKFSLEFISEGFSNECDKGVQNLKIEKIQDKVLLENHNCLAIQLIKTPKDNLYITRSDKSGNFHLSKTKISKTEKSTKLKDIISLCISNSSSPQKIFQMIYFENPKNQYLLGEKSLYKINLNNFSKS